MYKKTIPGKNNLYSINGFTLIELIIAMSIFFIMVISTYAPYNYYSQKAKLNIVSKEISQSLYNARNIAINGSSDNSGNTSIGLYFDNSSLNNTKIDLFSYPYTFSGSQIIAKQTGKIKIIKTIKFSGPITINNIGGKDNLLFFFSAISGSGGYYYYDNNPTINSKHDFIGNEIIINISYKGTTATGLNKNIIYNINTNIVDYN